MRFWYASLLGPLFLAACSSDTPAAATDGDAGTEGGGGADAGVCAVGAAPKGDDARCAASVGGTPCKTLTKALSLATAGCTVQLAAGSFGAGETFPLAIKDGVRVSG